jgi:diguanylate cyclase (GGDEF)-like protein
LKILVAEDESVARHVLSRLLASWGYEVTSVADGDAAWNALDEDDSLTLAILDWMMPGLNGLDLVQRLRAKQERPYTYVLLLTAKSGKSEVLQALNAGCDDYLTKPFDSEELQARLAVGKRITELQAQLTQALQATHHEATHDPLTGILNRKAILDVLGQEINRAKRANTTLSVALVDIDHFKVINDSHGHLVGDEVLRAITQRMHDLIRSYDKLGRFGGEEFLIVLPECGTGDAVAACERVCTGLASVPVHIGELNIVATASIGVATLGNGSDMEMLIGKADQELYAAKGNGRNQVHAAQESKNVAVPPVAITDSTSSLGR